jgi:hypothetical protein
MSARWMMFIKNTMITSEYQAILIGKGPGAAKRLRLMEKERPRSECVIPV